MDKPIQSKYQYTQTHCTLVQPQCSWAQGISFGNSAFLMSYITDSTKKNALRRDRGRIWTSARLIICQALFLRYNSARVKASGEAAAVPLCLGIDPCQEFQAFLKWSLALYRKHRATSHFGVEREAKQRFSFSSARYQLDVITCGCLVLVFRKEWDEL